MSLTKKWTGYAVKLHTKTAQAAAAVWLQQVVEQAFSIELQSQMDGPSFGVYNTFGSLVSGAPAARISTSGLLAFLAQCGVTGMLIDADGTHPGVVLYRQKMQQGGTRVAEATGAHLSATFANGILVPVSVDLPEGGDAILAAELRAIKDGATAPLVFASTDTLPADLYPAVSLKHTLGPVKLNATTVDGLKSARVEFGIQLEADKADSDIYPTFCCIRKIQPVVTLRGLHADLLTTLTVEGAYYTAAQVVVYARKRAEGGTFVADGTAEHVKFTLGKCRVEPLGISGNPAEIDVRITPWYTAGVSPVSPLAVSTASAIT